MHIHYTHKCTYIYIYTSEVFRKTNISYPLTHARTCAYREVRNNSFSQYVQNVLNELSLY